MRSTRTSQFTHRSAHFSFPLWQFLAQPLFSPQKIILNPTQFWNHYKIQCLERCWNYDPVRLLERCWVKDLQKKPSWEIRSTHTFGNNSKPILGSDR